jgi:tRNA pseudouridine32 synthase/23S rRNA pseudouridine746 synthase
MPLKEITADEMLARMLYRDGLMLIVDKPAGLPVHRGPKGGASLEDYFDALRFGLPRSPALAHRLDKDTSGCLVLGRHRKALAHLGLLFKHGKVGKTYWAVVEGGPDADEGTIELPLGRLDETRGWWMKPDPNGLPSVTTWKVLGRGFSLPEGNRIWHSASAPSPRLPSGRSRPSSTGYGEGRGEGASPHAQTRGEAPSPDAQERADLSPQAGRGESCRQLRQPPTLPSLASGGGKITWLALTPVTGRTHQLRVHCAASGWPIVGDNIYGTAQRFTEPPQLLHAREVVVPISKNKTPVRVTAPVPTHMRDWLRACGWNGGDPETQ